MVDRTKREYPVKTEPEQIPFLFFFNKMGIAEEHYSM
jgi:hypothetical protein